MAYASGKFAYALCDRCGFKYKYKDLRKEWNGAKTCPSCYEEKHPQLETTRNIIDPEALYEARPDTDLEVGNGRVSTNNDLVGRTILGLISNTSVGSVSIIENDNTVTQTLDSQAVTSALGSITVSGNITESVSVSGQAGTSAIGSPTVSADTVYTVTVASGTNSYGYGNKYYINGSVSPTLNLSEGETYRFDQSDSSNGGHPLRFSTTANGTHGGGSEYTTGVTTNGTPGSSGAYTQITVAVGAPTLYYYCTNHSGMGGQANTP
tara:strand:+ start:738 stop:1532 length:795 start_codon:yes stop_codon:yes gene_type:complete